MRLVPTRGENTVGIMENPLWKSFLWATLLILLVIQSANQWELKFLAICNANCPPMPVPTNDFPFVVNMLVQLRAPIERKPVGSAIVSFFSCACNTIGC